MPPTDNRLAGQLARLELLVRDGVTKLMQLAAVAAVLCLAYIVYGFITGGVTSWDALDPAARLRIGGNITQAVHYFNIILTVLVIAVSVVYHDEESLGYTFVVVGIALYYGVSMGFEYGAPGTVEGWIRSGNRPAMAVFNEGRLGGMLLGIPGAILCVMDLVRRIRAGVLRRSDHSALEYGGEVEEQAGDQRARPAPIAMFSKCWQLPYCREFIRNRCPIYHKRTKCWQHKVGCMCEEAVVRKAMEGMAEEARSEATNAAGQPLGQMLADSPEDARRFDLDSPDGKASKPTPPPPPRPKPVVINPRDVVIPVNDRITPWAKRERCRSCVIYNEHQRHKYGFFSPLLLVAVPTLMFLSMDRVLEVLKAAIDSADKVMVNLSLDPAATQRGMLNMNMTGDVANYIIIGCLGIILTTAVLRASETLIFRYKI